MISIEHHQEIRQAGEVVGRSGGRVHRVRLDNGQVILADSAVAYRIGRRVAVVAGAIVGPAGAAPARKDYQE
jgi:hypothetical protein